MILTSNDKKDVFLNSHHMAKRTVKPFPGSDYRVTFSESLKIIIRKTINDKKEFARILSEGKSKRISITHNNVILHVPYADREIAKKAGVK